jgi:hypothetical protein
MVASPNGGRVQRVGDFNAATRQSLQTLPDLVPPTAGTAGQISRRELPQSAFCAGLWLVLSGTTTAAAASTATAALYPVLPFSFIRRIRIYNNQGVEFWNTSGYGAYLYMRTLRTGFDPATRYPSAQLQGIGDPFAQYHVRPVNLIADETQNWRCMFWLPISFGPGLSHGLQLLQDPAITYTLEVTWGDTTDLYSATTGTVTLSSISLTPVIEEYAVPDESIDFPRLAYSKTVLEDIQALTSGTGDNLYRYTTGNIATKIIQELSNETAAVRQAIAPASVTNLQLKYAQTQVPYVIHPAVFLARQRALYGADLPAGVWSWELSQPMMLPEMVGTRDALNTARLTDLFTAITLSGVTLSNGNNRVIRESLVANRR